MISIRMQRLAAAISLPLLTSGAAMAEPSESDVKDATSRYLEGQKLLAEGKTTEAIERLRKAYALAPSPVIGVALARALDKAQRPVEALEAAEAAVVVEYRSTERTRAAREEARELVVELKRQVATLRIELRGVPAGASPRLLLDGSAVALDDAASGKRLRPGRHEVIAHLDGRDEQRAEANLTPGQTSTITLSFGEDARPAAATAALPPRPSPAPVAPQATGASAPPPPPSRAPERDGGVMRLSGYVLGGLGVAGLGLGTMWGLQSRSKHDDAVGACGGKSCPEAEALNDEARSLSSRANMSFVGGGLLLAGGITLLVLAPSADSPASARLAPSAAPGWLGLSASGSF